MARAVFESRIPVISAVGHEIDWTICDWVADLRAPTPSAAAELVVQNREELERRFQDFQARAYQAVTYLLESRRSCLEAFVSSYALKQPAHLVEQHLQRLDELLRQLQNYLKARLTDKTHRFRQLIGRLEALSPLAILRRGYSLTLKEDGTLIKEWDQVRPGDLMTTRLWRGTVKSKVIQSISAQGEDHG